jgi:hypothetical protein
LEDNNGNEYGLLPENYIIPIGLHDCILSKLEIESLHSKDFTNLYNQIQILIPLELNESSKSSGLTTDVAFSGGAIISLSTTIPLLCSNFYGKISNNPPKFSIATNCRSIVNSLAEYSARDVDENEKMLKEINENNSNKLDNFIEKENIEAPHANIDDNVNYTSQPQEISNMVTGIDYFSF